MKRKESLEMICLKKQPQFPPEEEGGVPLRKKPVCLFVCFLSTHTHAHTHTHTPRHTFIRQGPSKINQTGTWWRGNNRRESTYVFWAIQMNPFYLKMFLRWQVERHRCYLNK